jgi:hypothetical protein
MPCSELYWLLSRSLPTASAAPSKFELSLAQAITANLRTAAGEARKLEMYQPKLCLNYHPSDSYIDSQFGGGWVRRSG